MAWVRSAAATVGTLAAGAACAFLVIALSQSATFGVASLLQSAPPVYYVSSSASPVQSAQEQMQYFYIPKSVLPQPEHASSPHIVSLAAPRLTILNATNGTDDMPPWHTRSCAINSLLMQAVYVFPRWDQCGYLFHGNPEERIAPGTGGVISAPPNDPKCTPDKMGSDPCRKEWIRTVARNNHQSLVDCLTKVKGLSQTCDTYKRCGPTPGFSPLGFPGDVCSSGDGGYFKEPGIERMCGICDMYHAIAGMAQTEKAHDKDEVVEDEMDGGGCFAAESEVEEETRGRVPLHTVCVGERLRTDTDKFGEVLWVHRHRQAAPTLSLQLAEQPPTDGCPPRPRTLRLTPSHYLPVWGRGLVPAGAVREGDRVWVEEGGAPVEVARVSGAGKAPVAWVVVAGEEVVVSGVRASVWSSALGPLETLPFRFLHALRPELLKWASVSGAVSGVLDSPLLRAAARLNLALDLAPRRHAPAPPLHPAAAHAVSA